ncbi:hypothetical protein OSH11_21785 [Kaistia dalseonensis]|uniref:Adenylate cyclase n=1 Tax=Kaistia dalseonensis TaxID=410840 RepID=A0ABU0HCF3_9HYPH|nr:tetratricopeptide repeat protein [Kaistia dalseonensis]MCX5497344.1 hypothetical protein [Kaistia dalseonensis]MDQ0439981.1 hypothetical protein [Kaistia dalseonensis]
MSLPVYAADPPMDNAISPDEIRAAVATIKRCPVFSASRQLNAFLTYVVDKVLAGEADRIKAYSIATEALGRPESFDPAMDPIVRVEAGRLRRALAAYYEGEGATAPLRIDIPRGTYVPRFERSAAPMPAVEIAQEPGERGLGRLWLMLLLAIMVLALAALAYWWFSPAPRMSSGLENLMTPIAANRPTAPRIYVDTFTIANDLAIEGLSGDRFRARVATAMARFDEVTVVTRPEGDADYVVRGSVEEGSNGIVASALLVHRASGRVVWSGRFTAPRDPAHPAGPIDRLMRDIVVEIVQPYGVVMADRLARTDSADDGFACVIKAFDYWRNFDAAHHAAARSCLEALTRRYPNYALPFAQLAFFYVDEERFGFNPRTGTPALERALQAATTAVQLAPTSARAHEALQNAYFAAGRFDRALEAGAKAVSLNPLDTDIIADYGRVLIVEGHYERGMAQINQSAEANAAYPGWYDLYRGLAAFQAGDTAGMRTYLARTNLSANPLTPVLRLIAADRSGDAAKAAAIRAEMRVQFPALVADPTAELSRLVPNPDLVRRLVTAADAAGL